MQSLLISLLFVSAVAGPQTEGGQDAERRIIGYIKDNLQPGKPLVVSKLYNEVFTSPEERQVLDKLNRAFFRIPLFIIEYQVSTKALPSLEEIAGQFDFYGVEEADVVLSIMESDPRVPKFIQRDPQTGELVAIDIEKIKADARFNKLVDRTLTGWEGKPAPEVSGKSYDGQELSLSSLEGKTVLLYVWFTNCPPCVRITPELVALQEKFGGRNFTVLGANADRVLGLPYDDSVRAEYVVKHSISYPNIHLTPEARAALGNLNIFPTLFLIDANGTIVKHYVNFQPAEVLGKEIEKLSAKNSTSGV